MSQAMFGTGGAIFEGSVVAVAATWLAPSISLPMTSAIVAFYSVLLVLGPMQTWLDKLNGFLMPIYVIGLLAALWLAASEYGAAASVQQQWTISPAGFLACFAAYMGLWILPMCSFDYARFGRRSDVEYHSRFCFGLPFYLLTVVVNGLAGIYLVAVIPHDARLGNFDRAGHR